MFHPLTRAGVEIAVEAYAAVVTLALGFTFRSSQIAKRQERRATALMLDAQADLARPKQCRDARGRFLRK